MAVFDHPDHDRHEHVSFFEDRASGLRAIIAIHSTAPYGVSGGGCRMLPYPRDEEALGDALRLSRAMSYKLALADMPAGGAKAVVIGDPARDKTEALLLALGRAIDRLGGRFIVAEDAGTTPEDMKVIGRVTRFVSGRASDTSIATAHGVLIGMRVAVGRALGGGLEGRRVAVQGVGRVGAKLCRLLRAEGAEVVLGDVDRAAADRLGREIGAVVVPPDAIYDADVDVFAPCALGAVLDDRTIARLRCKVVAGSANNQLAADRHAGALAARGVLYAPDFVVNLGGVMGAALEGLQAAVELPIAEEQVRRTVAPIAKLLERVFDQAERRQVSPHVAAAGIAEAELERRRQAATSAPMVSPSQQMS